MRYLFDDTILDVAQRQALKSGEPILMEPKVFDVLIYLVENRHRAVTRDELLEVCWPGVYVSDGTLSRCLSRVRMALGQPRSASAPILTVHSRGYRFVAEVREIDNRPEAEELFSGPQVADHAKSDAGTERNFISIIHVAFDVGDQSEAAQSRVFTFLACCRRLVAERDGMIISIFGDEIVIQTGVPRATEQPATMAVEIAQGILDCAERHDTGLRIGIVSGWAVQAAGSGAAGPPFQTGLAPLRVTGAISPTLRELIVDEDTARIVGGIATFDPTTRVVLNGETRDLLVMRGRPDFEARRRGKAEPMFVGRDFELSRFGDLWNQARKQRGKIVYISGEPGIGKTRLVQEFIRRTSLQDEAILRIQCSPFHANTPFFPLIRLLCDMLQVDRTASPLRVLRVIEEFFERSNQPITDLVPLLASVLAAASPGESLPELSMSAERCRARTMASIHRMIEMASSPGPVLVWIDDFQSADPSTREVLMELAEELDQRAILMVACSRNGRDDPIVDHASVEHFPLERLNAGQCRRLLSEISERGLLPAGLADTVAERSDGVPLYLHEIVRMVSATEDAADTTLDSSAVPDSLHGLLATRLQICGEALPVLQWASILGRTFSKDILRRICAMEDAAFDAAIDKLVDVEVIAPTRGANSESYTFAHALMRDAAYGSTLLATRCERHLRVAQVLCAYFPEIVKAEPELVAVHFSASTRPELAIPYWRAAGDASIRNHAVREAQMLFRQALDAARTMNASDAKMRYINEVEEILASM